ncbi:hypothetical protein GZH53_09335 [Flavihumibacter sp. R14]|nr:hypothetical protein [Flavihumibacter soli]
MNKLLYLLIGFMLILLASSYLFIPNEIVISKNEQVESTERIVLKYLESAEHRLKWWPGSKDAGQDIANPLKYNNYDYEFRDPKLNSIVVIIRSGNTDLKSTVSWMPYSGNLIRLSWKTTLSAGSNPIKRFSRYLQAREIKANMTLIMERYSKFIANHKNVYGHNFRIERVTDTLLATTQLYSTAYPDNSQIYLTIDKIRKYLDRQGIQPTKPPMLNISSDAKGQYQTTVALPVPKRFQPDETILLRNMVPGNILVADVKGGRKSISGGFSQMEIFMQDFKLGSPAIYFESLITDRRAEPDTSKWITKIYYPIY